MSLFWMAQLLGILAFIVGITTFIHRDERKFKGQLAIYSLMISMHFFLMGANSAGFSALLTTSRTIISIFTRHTIFLVLFISLTLIFGLMNLKHPMELLPIMGTLISTWAFFRTHGLKTRYVVWNASACWAIYNIWLGSIGGSLIECSFMLINGYTIFRFRKMIQQGIDPFTSIKNS